MMPIAGWAGWIMILYEIRGGRTGRNLTREEKSPTDTGGGRTGRTMTREEKSPTDTSRWLSPPACPYLHCEDRLAVWIGRLLRRRVALEGGGRNLDVEADGGRGARPVAPLA